MQNFQSKNNPYKAASKKIYGSPWQLVIWGLCSHLGTVLTQILLQNYDPVYIFSLWLGIFFLGTMHDAMAANRYGGYPQPVKNGLKTHVLRLWLMQNLLIVTGLVVTIIFVYIAVYDYIPGIWLIFISLILFLHIIFAQRMELIPFAALLLLGGIVSLTFLVPFSLNVFSLCFGIGGMVFGSYFLIARQFADK